MTSLRPFPRQTRRFSRFKDRLRSAIFPAGLLASLLFAIPSHAVENAGEKRQSLNGIWEFTIDPAVVDGNGQWDTLQIPGNWDVQPRYSTHRGKAWHRRDFEVPADWKGQHLRLRFDAVYHEATVTLNGQNLGSHTGGYTPFEFDVTDLVKIGSKNTLLVEADNTYGRGAWWPWGGISRDVTLIANNDARIVWQHIRAEPDLAAGTATVFVRYKLANSGTAPLQATVSSSIDGTPGTLETRATIPAKGDAIVEAKATLQKKDVRLWHFDFPNLYTLATTLATGDKILHSQTDRFGIREVKITADGLYLNGEKIRVGGFNRVSDSNTTGSTEPDALVRKDVDLMKDAGAVFARLMHTPQAPNLLDYLDEKGMLIFAEVPVWGSSDPQVKKDNPLTKQWLREMIERDYNHPCIIGWSPGNEITNHYDYVESMNEYIRKELDPHRLIAYISYTAYKDNHGPKNDPVTVSDLAMVNVYGNGGAFAGLAGKLRKKWPDKAVFFSEYGDHQIGKSLDAMIPQLRSIWDNMTREPYVIGGALWTYNDYRSGYHGTPASGNREWGVVTVDRELKEAYWQIRRIHNPVKSLKVENGVVTIQPRSKNEAPSYTLRGYKLDWKTLDASGSATAEGSIPLPEIASDSPAWSAPIPGAKGAASVEVTLVTPQGYRVADNVRLPSGSKP